MTTDEALTALEQLLRDERRAVVRLDAVCVERIAEEKQALMAALRDANPPLDRKGRARLRTLRASLYENALLLAHARDCLRDVLRAFHTASVYPRSAARVPALRRGVRLSLVG
jgi:hypothetical protein